MISKCEKCGSELLVKEENGYRCTECGAVMNDGDNVLSDITSETAENKTVENDTAEKQNNKKSKFREVIEFVFPIIIALIIAILLKSFVFATARVPTGSMLNTIQKGDNIFASRVSYINNDPERYDVIILKYPDDERQFFVKRIIGLPGETVEVKDGIVFVTKTDGETIQLKDDFVTVEEPQGDYGPYEVPEDSYFVMGDNRNSSWDSREWENKFVQRKKIIGKVLFRYLPKPGKIE